MAKLNVVKPQGEPVNIGNRVYSFVKETKQYWLYQWSDCPKDTPEWSGKLWLPKADYPERPGDHIDMALRA